MKATINNITFEGTPAEFAEFIQLQTPNVECAAEPKIDKSIIKKIRHETSSFLDNECKINVSYQGVYVGIMNLKELSVLLDVSTSTLKNNFKKGETYEHNGYTATLIAKSSPRRSIRLKATDTKGNNRIYSSIRDFMAKTKTPDFSFKNLRKKNPKGPWKINGYIVEKIN